MTTIARTELSHAPVDARFWPHLAATALQWAGERQVPVRDAVVLVPYAQLLTPARQAFARCGGWQPRVETTQTLARAKAPPPDREADQLSFIPAIDRVMAAALLRGSAWGASAARRDPQSFEHAVAAVVETAQALARAAGTLAPQAREAYWAQGRVRLAPTPGPGATECLLARMALEWAARSGAAPTDVLFELVPSAWIVVQAGGEDPLVASLLAQTQAPALVIDTDPPEESPFETCSALPVPRALLCDGLEGEAQATAAELLAALQRGATPVALIAHDRVLVRRVRALLEGAGVALRDETGWKLSTTRAAARVMALLRAAHPRAGPDAWLDWLKAENVEAAALARMETRWRKDGPGGTDPLWQARRARLDVFSVASRQPLSAWLAALDEALDQTAFHTDAAGRQVLAALHPNGDDPAWQDLAASTRMDLDDFAAWVDAALEQANFVPPPSQEADVVVTPLARALLRPFGAVVFPGTDERTFGTQAGAPALLGEALATALGVLGAREHRRVETLAFAQLLRMPQLVLLRRRAEGAEPLGASPLVERAQLARQRAGGAPWPEVEAVLPVRRVRCQPVRRPSPAAAVLPPSLSASAVEALRDCPYRFFARVQLGLSEPAELEAALEKRDYGTWVHAVLHRFHQQRGAAQALELEVDALMAMADQMQRDQGLDAAQLLPYRTALEKLAPMYVQWLHERDVEGWNWVDGETARTAQPALLGGTALHGHIDRIDRLGDTLQLLDYKTGSTDELRKKVKTPLEDTQLAVYAVLTRGAGALRAAYLALDERRGPLPIEHRDVEASAQALLEGLARDLARIRDGAGLSALGEGRLCEHCEARGLCRRDHWAAEAS